MDNGTNDEWRELLRFVLSMRLEINAMESALRNTGALTDAQIKEIRLQARNTANAWSSEPGDDLLKLIRIHSSPGATMFVPPTQEG